MDLHHLEETDMTCSASSMTSTRTSSETLCRWTPAAPTSGTKAKEDIKLDINGSYLVISAEHNSENDQKEDNGKYIRRERSFGSYKRSFDISDVNADNISAEYKNGVLCIDLPKKKPEEPVAKRLEIK